MQVHLVFVTRYRRQIFDHDATEKLRTYFSNVCADFEAELVEMDGEPDHVHLLINSPPRRAISSLVNSLKGVSGRLLRRDRPDSAVRYYYKGVLWSPGYFASSCGGARISVIRQYIEPQQTPGQVENRALYPRPEERGFTAHRIKHGLLTTAYIPAPAYVMSALLTTAYIRKRVCRHFRGGCVRRISAASRPSPVKGTASVAAISSANTLV